MRRCLSVWAALAALLVNVAWAQEPPVAGLPGLPPEFGTLESIPTALLGEALTVSILASVGKPSETPSWEARDVKYTIPGAPVSVRMIGRDTVIVITITPYRNKGGLLLVAQGQVWIKDGDSKVQYRTTVDTLSVKLGERVLFYPFGAKPESGAPLRVELVMDAWADPEGQSPAAVPAATPTQGATPQGAAPQAATPGAAPQGALPAPVPGTSRDKVKP